MNLVQDGKFINDERGNPFAVLYTAADAAKVVAACNAHDKLVAALKAARLAIGDSGRSPEWVFAQTLTIDKSLAAAGAA